MSKRHAFPPKWPVPEDYLIELGRITAVWAIFEIAVNAAISKLAGYKAEPFDLSALVMVMHSNMHQRINIISALCEQRLPDHPRLAAHEAVITKLKAAQKARNRFTHGGLYTNATGGVGFINASARGKLKTTAEPMPLGALKEATAKIHEATCELQSFVSGKHVKRLWELS